jgi:hypothetical protein
MRDAARTAYAATDEPVEPFKSMARQQHAYDLARTAGVHCSARSGRTRGQTPATQAQDYTVAGTIQAIPLGTDNVYVVKDRRVILVDGG